MGEVWINHNLTIKNKTTIYKTHLLNGGMDNQCQKPTERKQISQKKKKSKHVVESRPVSTVYTQAG